MRFIIASLALVFSASIASSQTEKISFRTLATANATFPDLWVAAAGKAVPLAFSNTQPSDVLKVDKTSPLKIFKGPLDDKGKPTDTAPTLVELPASPSILLLGWMEEEKPAFLAVADFFATAKKDDWQIINRTTKALTIQFGATATAVPIEANGNQTVKCTVPVGEGAAVTVAAQQPDSSWKTVYTSTWPVYADKRGLILIGEKNGRINVDYIADDITRKPAPKKR